MTRADGLGLVFGLLTAGLVMAFGASVWTLGPPLTVLLLLLADGVARPASRVLLPVVSHGPRDGDAVALTFDDGPNTETTPAIAAALEAAGARGTFFCIGRYVEQAPEVARALFDAGHELGNHSHGHSRLLNFAGPVAMERQILRGAEAVRAVAPDLDPLYRPPVGLKSPPLAKVAKKLGLTVVNWSLHGHDTRGLRAEEITARILQRVRPGDIVCLHDGCDQGRADRSATLAALPGVLDGLRERGLRAVTVSELLRRSSP